MKTNILKMIEQAEVEWKPLGEVTKYEQPTRYLVKSTNYQDDYETPVLTAGKTFILGYTNEIEGIYSASRNPVIIFDDFTTANKWVDFDFKVKSSAMKIITSDDETKYKLKYIYYWLNILTVEENTDHKRQWISNFSNKLVPIPPLELQKEIVKRLDILTELEATLEATLEAELSLRKKQYQYYRDFLLSENELAKVGFEWKSLGELAEIGTGSRNTNEAVIDGIYPFFVRSQEPRKINEYEFDEVAIITAGDGVGVGKVFHFVTGKYALHQRAYRIVVKSNALLPKFLFYFIKTSFAHYLEKASVNSSVTSLRKPMFEKFQIPIPPLETQAKIVAILDKFDRLTNSISDGLPKEIELRRKQYEYYRELLLNFPNP